MDKDNTPEEQIKEWNWFIGMGCFGLKCDGCRHGQWCEDTEKMSNEMSDNNDCRNKSKQDKELSNISI